MKYKKIDLRILFISCFALACNLSTPQTSSNANPESTSTSPLQITDTEIPTNTASITPNPTATFTPMPIQQLATTKHFDFTQPLPLSTPLADPDSISGVAYNGYGPIMNARVVISETYCGTALQETKTDTLGYYTFTNIPAGQYYLEIQSPSIINLCGEEIIKNSSALAYDFVRPRSGLVMVYPKDQQTITEINPSIEWEAVEFAFFYVVELTVQTSGEPGWNGNWTGAYLGTWLTNSTTFTIPYSLDKSKDYRIDIVAYTSDRLPLAMAYKIRFHY